MISDRSWPNWERGRSKTPRARSGAHDQAVACSARADIASVVHRLGMPELANKTMGLNFPVTLDGKPTDAVFKAFATISMTGIPEGGSNTPRFDLLELVKMILKDSEAFAMVGHLVTSQNHAARMAADIVKSKLNSLGGFDPHGRLCRDRSP